MAIKCYRTGGCGPYEMYSCHECSANNPVYHCLHGCEHLEYCKNHILTGYILSCPNYSDLSAHVMKNKTCVDIKNNKEENKTKKIKVTKMKKNITTKVKEDKEKVGSCPACTLKEYKSKTKFAYSFALNFHQSVQEDEQIQFYIGKDNSTNEWMLYITYHDVDYDLSEINREFSVPIKYCPVCGRELK